MRRLFSLLFALMSAAITLAQDYPTVTPTAIYTTSEGETVEGEASEPLSAPVSAVFEANPENVDEYDARYEWTVWRNSPNTTPLLHRFDEKVEYTFDESGTYFIRLQATFTAGADTVFWPEEGEQQMMTVTVAESKLEFPNAFSPNGDGYNDVFRAKDGWKSIVSFEATIFNRWGNKIYSWDDLNGGWDGRWHGRVVKDGVYFVVVKATGADGIEYNIRRDVNVLTGTRKENNTNNGDGGSE